MKRGSFSGNVGIVGLSVLLLLVGAATIPGSSSPLVASADAARGIVAAPDDGDDTDGSEAAGTAAEDAAATALVESFRGQLEGFLPRWNNADWGVLVTSLDRGDTLYARNAHRAMAPASNVKLLTTAAALHHLGSDYRFRTFLLTDAAPRTDGVLEGDLILYGTGDPTLGDGGRTGDDPLREMARSLHERGIRVVDGDVVGDGSYFEGRRRPRGWGRTILNESFAAPVGALQFNENVAVLRVRPGSGPGAPVRVETTPESAPLAVDVRARTVSQRTGHAIWALRDDPEGPVSITGQIRTRDPDVWRRITVNDPALYAARSLRTALEKEGIEVRGRVRTETDRDGSVLSGNSIWAPGLADEPAPRVLAEHRSAPILEILRVVNQESHNLYAESVVRTLGRIVDGDSSFEGGARVVQRFVVREAGVPPEQVRPVDGSGLSRENEVSPYAFVRLLDHMATGPSWDDFWSTLPRAGTRSELRRMYRSPAADNLRAKTGTLRTVSALSGVVRADNGERLAFSILSNEVPSTSLAKAIEDRIGVELASFWRPQMSDPPVEAARPASTGVDLEE